MARSSLRRLYRIVKATKTGNNEQFSQCARKDAGKREAKMLERRQNDEKEGGIFLRNCKLRFSRKDSVWSTHVTPFPMCHRRCFRSPRIRTMILSQKKIQCHQHSSQIQSGAARPPCV